MSKPVRKSEEEARDLVDRLIGGSITLPQFVYEVSQASYRLGRFNPRPRMQFLEMLMQLLDGVEVQR